ncbi:SUZ domain-containing protein [Pleurotus pulmonarius]|nr:hypothetical protein EYR36_004254 [Pleurotus pulmonarius]KAF4579315.1 hypothetical protein EYR36_001125 [Pleurotus pulmonarius]KAF4603350.1 hypothetical protein EYR38_003763 [Pleurotus pulmonarius]
MPTDDPWDQEPPNRGLVVTRPSKQLQRQVVPDDWDDDDDEEDALPDPELNKKIWHEANTKAPMPEVLVKSSSTVVAPPASAFQPQLRILKRPSATPPASNTPSQVGTRDSVQEREARYNAARERIFGTNEQGQEPEGSTNASLSSLQSAPLRDSSRRMDPTHSSTPPRTSVTRNPRGPADAGLTMMGTDGSPVPRGFGRRIGDSKPVPQADD